MALENAGIFQPDFLVTDVMMPVMNGIDLAILLRAQLPACRLLLFSGQSLTVDLLADAATKGYNFDILAKPVHPTVMLK
jgi:CheY-like chemotaxis protein